jgi:hypothetical protein
MTTATDPVRRHDLGLLESAQPGVMATAPPAGSRGRVGDHIQDLGALHSPAGVRGATVPSYRLDRPSRSDGTPRARWHGSRRSARARPPGSGQRAGATQGLWSPSTTSRGQYDLDRILGVALPGGMDSHRLGSRPGPDPAADHLACQQQRCRRSALVGLVRSRTPSALRSSATRDRSAGRARQGRCKRQGVHGPGATSGYLAATYGPNRGPRHHPNTRGLVQTWGV